MSHFQTGTTLYLPVHVVWYGISLYSMKNSEGRAGVVKWAKTLANPKHGSVLFVHDLGCLKMGPWSVQGTSAAARISARLVTSTSTCMLRRETRREDTSGHRALGSCLHCNLFQKYSSLIGVSMACFSEVEMPPHDRPSAMRREGRIAASVQAFH